MLAMWHDEKWPPGDPGVPACRVVKSFAHGRKSWDLALKLREKRRQQPEIIKKKRVDMVYQTKNAEHQRGRFLLGGKPSKDQRLSVLFGQCSDPFWLHHLFLGALINGAVTLFVDPGRMGNMINKIGDFSSRNHPETQWIVSFCTW